MRIWSLNPKYLDTKGLVALWRETLLARKVLLGQTKGYKNHSQLIRFKNSKNPISSIDFYLEAVWNEANSRGYNFDNKKFNSGEVVDKIAVNSGQVSYEANHLLKKLSVRDKDKHSQFINIEKFELHPLFVFREGGIEDWEKVL